MSWQKISNQLKGRIPIILLLSMLDNFQNSLATLSDTKVEFHHTAVDYVYEINKLQSGKQFLVTDKVGTIVILSTELDFYYSKLSRYFRGKLDYVILKGHTWT